MRGSARACDSTRGERGDAGEAGGRRARVGHGPPMTPSGPAREVHAHLARSARERCESQSAEACAQASERSKERMRARGMGGEGSIATAQTAS